MKKILLVMVMLVLAVSMTFAWGDYDLLDMFGSNYVRVRFTDAEAMLGTDNFRVGLGLNGLDKIFLGFGSDGTTKSSAMNLSPLVGLGYGTDAFKIGLLYQGSYTKETSSNTGAIGLKFPTVVKGLNLVVPFSYGTKKGSDAYGMTVGGQVWLDTGINALSTVWLRAYYGTADLKMPDSVTQSTLGFELRLNSKMPTKVIGVEPSWRFYGDFALNNDTHTTKISASPSTDGEWKLPVLNVVGKKPAQIGTLMRVALKASNDYVSFAFIPALGYFTAMGTHATDSAKNINFGVLAYGLEMEVDLKLTKNVTGLLRFATKINRGVSVDTVNGSSAVGNCGVKWTF